MSRQTRSAIGRGGVAALLLTALSLAGSGAGAESADSFYRLQSAVTLPGKAPGWDYVSFDAGRLFLGRRAAGVSVFDVAQGRVIATIDQSDDANVATLVPSLDRGFTTNGDGSTTIFVLSTLKTLQRVKFGEDADSGFFEPVTQQMVFTMGDSKAFAFLDARTGRMLGRLATDSGKLDATVADGQGALYTAERDRNAILKIDARTRRTVAEWPTTGCEQPTGLAFDRAHRRLFVGCRGKAPVLLVMASDDGRVVTALEIGHGNDGVIYDPDSAKIYSSNGVDALLVIYDQIDADHYRLSQAVTTRPMARTMTLDPRSKTVYLVAAEGAVDPTQPVNRAVAPFYPNVYFDDSFVVLTYARR